ncbi:MAG: CDP-glucose 4,6-dehydratase [Verrucomicrobiae bacterium]|nr:CDP-glucose 4,6-dehydratase [Verrucomicrobiae bacterium]
MGLQNGICGAFRGQSVLVTGHTGFKGSWLCEWLLALGARVTGLALDPPTQPSLFHQLDLSSRMDDRRADVRNPEAVRLAFDEARPDYVFHLAAQPLVIQSYTEPVSTWETNVLGTIHVLECLRHAHRPCAAVIVTTDKCYDNREWCHAYREQDTLGGHDPYSSSKAAVELAVESWRRSFFAADHPVRIASARAGNVIGGGDWAKDRLVPDAIRALGEGRPIPVRHPMATRAWQHVLEPLGGYLLLGACLAGAAPTPAPRDALLGAFNFGPPLESNRTVRDVAEEILRHWPGAWEDRSEPSAPHEAGFLNLAHEKAFHMLGWRPRWDFAETISRTLEWYREVSAGADPGGVTRRQIMSFTEASGIRSSGAFSKGSAR